MIISMFAAALLLAEATPAATPAKATDADPLVCKTEAVAGSRLPKKVCAPKSEWERRRQEAQDATQKSQNQRVLNGG